MLAWMFHGTIVFGGKGPATFWEKEWGSMDSKKYNAIILENIEAFLCINPNHTFIYMQDNVPSHCSKATQIKLEQQGIPYIK
jgi:hypothetical protein